MSCLKQTDTNKRSQSIWLMTKSNYLTCNDLQVPVTSAGWSALVTFDPQTTGQMGTRLKTGSYWSRFHCLKGAGLHKPMCYELCSESSQSLGRARLPSWPLNGSHTETNLMRKVFEWDLPEQNKLSVAKERRDREGRRARRTRQVGCYSINTAFSQNDPEDQAIQTA